MTGSLQGQTVVVTGAGRSIGRIIAVRCAEAGGRLVLVGRAEPDLARTAALVGRAGGEALVFTADVTDAARMAALADHVNGELGGADLLVNAEGRLGAVGPSWDAEPEEWWGDLGVNLRGVFVACRSFLPGMIQRGRGRVVNVVGGGTRRNFPFTSASATGEVAVMRFTENLAAELDVLGAPPRVFSLSPRFLRADVTERLERAGKGRHWANRMAERLAQAQDVSPDLVASMVIEIGAGRLDALHGRYLQGGRDPGRLDELRRDAETATLAERRLLGAELRPL